ncbi:MAG: hypothetical protein ABSB15_06385 [Bryobacteraceae bacterium]
MHCRDCKERFWQVKWAGVVIAAATVAAAVVVSVAGMVLARQTRMVAAPSARLAPAALPQESSPQSWTPWAEVSKEIGGGAADTHVQGRWMSESSGLWPTCTLEIRPLAGGEGAWPAEAIQAIYLPDFGSFPRIERWHDVSISKARHGVLRVPRCVRIIDVAADRDRQLIAGNQ